MLYNLLLYANFILLIAFAHNIIQPSFYFKILYILVAYLLIGVAGYFINDLFDKRADLLAKKFNITSIISKPVIIVIVSILFIAGFLLVKHASPLASYILIIQLILLLAYSHPITRLKEKGLLGVIVDGAYAHLLPEIILLIVLQQYVVIEIGWLLVFLAFTYCVGIRDILIHQIEDAKNDTLGGVKTLATNHPKSAIDLAFYSNIAGAVLIITLLSLAYIKQQQVIWLISAVVLAISYLYQLVSKRTEYDLNNDYLIRNYIIITSLLYIYLAFKIEAYWLVLFLAHPYFISFVVNKIINNIKLVLKYFLKIVIGNLILTYIPILINHILFFVFKIVGRDLKQKPLYKRENEFSLFKKIRAIFQ